MAKPVQQMLQNAKYKYLERAKQDITTATKLFKTLTPKLERYTFPTGISKELICLDGTIPIIFRNAKYNIPIAIFISDNHPMEAPICYVRPTRDMTIKTSRHVDGSGRVYMPYLSEWDGNRQSDNLIGAIQVMQIIFGQMCPVYQKTKEMHPIVSYPGSQPDSSSGSGSTSGTISMPMPPFSSQPQPYSSDSTGTIKEEHIRASLLSAIEDQFKFKSKEKAYQIEDEIKSLKKTSEDLNRGKKQLDDMKTRMSNEIDELTVAKSKLQELDNQLQEFIVKYDKEGENINPDEVYGPNQPLFKQLLEAVAEENAVVDAIYYTGEGLRKGVITLDVFLKSVRELSRRQFMLRALMRACRTKASLPNC